MERSIRHLGQLGTLHSASFAVEDESPDGREVSLRLDVVEDPYMGELEYGLLYERVNGPVTTFSLTRRNILGSGKTMILDSALGARRSYSARLISDWLFKMPIQTELGLHRTENRREARSGRLLKSRLDERREGQVYRLSKKLPGNNQASLRLRNEEVDAMAVDGFQLPSNLVAIGGNAFRVRYPHQGVELSFSHGPEVRPLEPGQARSERLQLEFAGGPLFKGPGAYTSLKLEHRRLIQLSPRTQLAYRLRGGIIDLRSGTLPFLEQLNIGGSDTLRGSNFKEFTGDRLLLANLELRRPLSERVEAVAFVDWGDAWDSTLRGLTGKTTLGIGARIDIRLFRLRLDIGKSMNRGGVRFSLGVGHIF
jgi:outer membrane protein insertion porin family